MAEAVDDPHAQTLATALAHHRAGRLPQADAGYRQILTENPNHPGAPHWRGVLATQVNRLDVAIELIRRAISLRPDVADFHCNLGNALRLKGLLDDAIASYQHALAIRHDYADAHNGLGNAFKRKKRIDEALECYRRALAIEPDYVEAHANLASVLRLAGRLEESVSSFRHALALRPELAATHSNLLVALNYHPGVDAATLQAEAEQWNRQFAEPLAKHILPHANDRSPNRRLRIGYVSSDFQTHVSAYFLDPLLRSHDHKQVAIFCYAEVANPDDVSARFQSMSDGWRGTAGASHEQVADVIRRDGIDILVDLKLHTNNNRLLVFARKPAPVQVTWLGYPGTTGLQTIDYRLTDPYLDPPGLDDAFYSEESIRLPDCFWCYDPLATTPAVSELPAMKNGYVTFGCLNNFCKVNPVALKLWCSVLRAVESSRLLMLAPEGESRERVLGAIRNEGIQAERVEFVATAPRANYLQRYQQVDISLDPIPYSGHTTTFDSLWMGVPVVTLPGARVVSRAGASILTNVGLPNLIAQTPEEYQQIAADLAGDLPRLRSCRSTLRQRMEQSPLMDGPRFARNVEAAYRQMWRKWCAS